MWTGSTASWAGRGARRRQPRAARRPATTSGAGAAADARERRPAERLVDELWGDERRGGERPTGLRVLAARALGDGDRDPGRGQPCACAGPLDLQHFERLASEARPSWARGAEGGGGRSARHWRSGAATRWPTWRRTASRSPGAAGGAAARCARSSGSRPTSTAAGTRRSPASWRRSRRAPAPRASAGVRCSRSTLGRPRPTRSRLCAAAQPRRRAGHRAGAALQELERAILVRTRRSTRRPPRGR